MAKTTTRTKPTTVKKSEAAGSAAPEGAADIRMIPLNQLEPSPLNVRKVAASASDDAELFASIRETGIKQNLVVHALSDTRFAVDAGGRRLKALKQLAEDGVIPADHPVPCLIEDERNAILTSTTENLQRAAMHPADQFEAFEAMIAEGRSEDEIALKFGVSVDLVRRRLKLARVAPEIIEQFRAGDLTLECVMAFTLTDDHDRQLAVWNAVKGGYHIHPQSIKRQLTETAHSANSALGRFVGIEAYEAAGGVLLRDLFDDRASAHMENPELLERLAIEKLQAAAKPFEAAWKWVEVHLSVDYAADLLDAGADLRSGRDFAQSRRNFGEPGRRSPGHAPAHPAGASGGGFRGGVRRDALCALRAGSGAVLQQRGARYLDPTFPGAKPRGTACGYRRPENARGAGTGPRHRLDDAGET
jgi:ParB family chromosome partitioning protein